MAPSHIFLKMKPFLFLHCHPPTPSMILIFSSLSCFCFTGAGAPGEQTGPFLRLGEGDHVPYALEAEQHHQYAVEAKGDAPVGRRAHFERLEEKAELLGRLLFCDVREA